MTIEGDRPGRADPGDAALDPGQRRAYRRAAARARDAYPGALGELVERELLAFAEFGYRLAGDGLIDRLAAEVLSDVGDRTGASR
jgi:hypothetical protein